jgi:hypothetical protein
MPDVEPLTGLCFERHAHNPNPRRTTMFGKLKEMIGIGSAS